MSETLKLMRVEQRTNAKGYTNWYCVFEGRKGEFDKQCFNDSVAEQAQQYVGQIVNVDWNVQQTSYGEWKRVAAVGPNEQYSGVPSSPAAPAPSVSQSAPGAGATSGLDNGEQMLVRGVACQIADKGMTFAEKAEEVAFWLWCYRNGDRLAKRYAERMRQKEQVQNVPPPVQQTAPEPDLDDEIPF